MKASGEVLAITGLLGIEAAKLVISVMPDHSDVRRAGADDLTTRFDTRTGEVIALVLVLAVGAQLAYVAGSPVPLVVAAGSAAAVVLVYESLLRRVPLDKAPADG